MRVLRPNILTIAGFDPSNGAGLTADVKTIESCRGYALSVCSANTVQNDVQLNACHWTDPNIMKDQIHLLFERFSIDVVKIGIVESWEVLDDLLNTVHSLNPEVKVILDPVLKSSSNFNFHDSTRNGFESVLKKTYLITPNYLEVQELEQDKSIEETIKYLSEFCHVYLKGGHRSDRLGTDELYTTEGKTFSLNPKVKGVKEKHGSGCILSSAISTYLAHGYPLLKACLRGKRYTERALKSNETLLAYHG